MSGVSQRFTQHGTLFTGESLTFTLDQHGSLLTGETTMELVLKLSSFMTGFGLLISAMSRVVLALLMSVGVGTHVYLKVNTQNPQWFIYMTNQVGILFKRVV